MSNNIPSREPVSYAPPEGFCFNHRVQSPRNCNIASTIAIALGILGIIAFCTALIMTHQHQHVSILGTLAQHKWLVLGVSAVPILGLITKFIAPKIFSMMLSQQLNNIKIDWRNTNLREVTFGMQNKKNFTIHDFNGNSHKFHLE